MTSERKKKYAYCNFECPRCGYNTPIKANIRNHFARKTQCPCSDPDAIVLTDEIKEFVLANRQYKPKPKPVEKATVSKTVNNNYIQVNQLNQQLNLVDKMDYQSKATKYVDYMQKKGNKHLIESYKNHVENVLFDEGFDTDNLKRLMDAPFIHELTEHDTDDHLNTLDKVTRKAPVPTKLIGVMYDAKTKKMYLYDEDAWEDLQEKPGIKKLISHIRQLYWNTYEEYLIKKMRTHHNMQQRSKGKELLMEYYTFLNTFDLKPDNLHNEDIYKIWTETTAKVKVSTKKEIYKNVVNVIKNNSASNISILNKDIKKLLMTDKEFEESLFNDEENFNEESEEV